MKVKLIVVSTENISLEKISPPQTNSVVPRRKIRSFYQFYSVKH